MVVYADDHRSPLRTDDMRERIPSPSTPLTFLVSTAHFDALATNNSLGCLLNASRPTEWMLLEGAGGYGIRPYGVAGG